MGREENVFVVMGLSDSSLEVADIPCACQEGNEPKPIMSTGQMNPKWPVDSCLERPQ